MRRQRYKDAIKSDSAKSRFAATSAFTMNAEERGETPENETTTYGPLEEGSENKQHYEEEVGTLSENEGEAFVFSEDVETGPKEGGIGETGVFSRDN